MWSTDTTYMPMARGCLYLGAVLDQHSRYVLSNALEVGCGLTALHGALGQQPALYSFNAGQGSQFTSSAFEQALRQAGGRISRDGRGHG